MRYKVTAEQIIAMQWDEVEADSPEEAIKKAKDTDPDYDDNIIDHRNFVASEVDDEPSEADLDRMNRGADDTSYRRDMTEAGRGHLVD